MQEAKILTRLLLQRSMTGCTFLYKKVPEKNKTTPIARENKLAPTITMARHSNEKKMSQQK